MDSANNRLSRKCKEKAPCFSAGMNPTINYAIHS
jgi:hypothetical protein